MALSLHLRLFATTILLASAGQAAEPPAPPQGTAGSSRFTISAEIRGRAESATAVSFRPDTRAGHYLHRLRVDAGFRPASWLRFHGRFQDSRAAGWDDGPKPGGIQNTLEIGEGFIELGAEENAGWGAAVGRQPIVFGAMRVMSTSNWGNVGPRWDGARAFLRANGFRLDLFAAAPVRPVDGKLDRWFVPGRRAYGVHGAVRRVPRLDLVESYVFAFTKNHAFNESGRTGPRRFAAVGARVVDRITPRLDFETEFTAQAGGVAGQPIRAFGLVGELGYRLTAAPESPRVFARHHFATGDRDPDDGRVSTLQQMYATDKWGTADGVAWRNIHETVAGVGLAPARPLKLLLQARNLRLATRADALYGFSGAHIAFNPLASSSHVGVEADARVIWQVNPRFQLYCGYGYLVPGQFLQQSTPGAGRHIAYLMWTARL